MIWRLFSFRKSRWLRYRQPPVPGMGGEHADGTLLLFGPEAPLVSPSYGSTVSPRSPVTLWTSIPLPHSSHSFQSHVKSLWVPSEAGYSLFPWGVTGWFSQLLPHCLLAFLSKGATPFPWYSRMMHQPLTLVVLFLQWGSRTSLMKD